MNVYVDEHASSRRARGHQGGGSMGYSVAK
jgi:hypothetical protein